MYMCVRVSAVFLFHPMVRLQDAMNSNFSRPDSIVDAYHDTPLRWMPFHFEVGRKFIGDVCFLEKFAASEQNFDN